MKNKECIENYSTKLTPVFLQQIEVLSEVNDELKELKESLKNQYEIYKLMEEVCELIERK